MTCEIGHQDRKEQGCMGVLLMLENIKQLR
jgi:hypothetical protein